MMDFRVMIHIEEIYRQDAKFTEREEERSREKFQEKTDSLCELSAVLASWR
jgi:hypothetical protein